MHQQNRPQNAANPAKTSQQDPTAHPTTQFAGVDQPVSTSLGHPANHSNPAQSAPDNSEQRHSTSSDRATADTGQPINSNDPVQPAPDKAGQLRPVNSDKLATAPTRPATRLSTIRLLCFLTVFVGGTDTFLISAILPELRAALHVSVAQSGWFISAYAVGYIIVSLIGGPLSDRHDRKQLLLIGQTAFTLFTLLCALGWDFGSLFAFRLLSGAAAALVIPQIWASIPVLVPKERVATVMGNTAAGLSVAMIAGIPLGAVLSTASWKIPFLVVALLSAALTVTNLVRFPQVRTGGRTTGKLASTPTTTSTAQGQTTTPTAAANRPAWPSLRIPTFWLSLLGYFVFQIGTYLVFSFMASWWSGQFGASEYLIAGGMVAVGLLQLGGTFLGPRLTRALGLRRSILLLTPLVGLGYGLVSLAPNQVLAILLPALAFCLGGAWFPLLTLHLQSFAPSARGTISALASATMYLSVLVAGAVGGGLLELFHGRFTGLSLMAFAASAVLGLVLLLAGGLLRKE